ncbi:hypothetical protein NPIL_198151 [Nephila pilipes]|uniref:Uncharacterized protein n=1 Tax=Nephila pilipes TaxID=299642 RepID=A0A8X6N5V7_NEPPI|nr:hypothetical protein NPIL_198151 [Nephila pilipes]
MRVYKGQEKFPKLKKTISNLYLDQVTKLIFELSNPSTTFHTFGSTWDLDPLETKRAIRAWNALLIQAKLLLNRIGMLLVVIFQKGIIRLGSSKSSNSP